MIKLSTKRVINQACQGLIKYLEAHWEDSAFLAGQCGEALIEELQPLPEEKQIGALELAIKYSFPHGIDWQRAERSLPDKARPYEFYLVHAINWLGAGRAFYRSDWGFAIELEPNAVKAACVRRGYDHDVLIMSEQIFTNNGALRALDELMRDIDAME